MKAVARLCLTYGTALPIQRWLGAFLLLAGALDAVSRLLGWRGPPGLPIIAMAMYLLSVTFLTGYLIRELSAPRTHRFLPHFRARMLTAFLLVVLVVSAPSLLLMALSAGAAGQQAAAAILLVTTGCVLFTFFPHAVFGFGLLVGPLVLLLAGFYERTGRPPSELLGAHSREIAATIWAAVWLGFAAWYVRGSTITKAGAPRTLGRLALRGLADASGVFSKDDALRTTLTAAYPLRPKHRLLRLALSLAVMAAVVGLLARFGSKASAAYLVALAIGAGIQGPIGAERISRRARALWLKGGESRRRLFSRAERIVWIDSMVPMLVMLLGLTVAAGLAFDVEIARLARLVVLVTTTATLGTYVGLLFLHGAQSFVAAVVLLASPLVAGVWMTVIAPSELAPLIAIAGGQIAATAAARALAIRRWQRADWLAFRPIRVASQSQRA